MALPMIMRCQRRWVLTVPVDRCDAIGIITDID
jgi:hypothetical protein